MHWARTNVLRAVVYKVRYIFAFAVLFSVIYNLLRMIGPLFMILIYDRVLPSRSEETLVALFLLVIVFLVVMMLLDYSRRRILARFGAQFQESVENFIFDATNSDMHRRKNGAKPSAGLDEVDRLRGFFHSSSLVAILDFLCSPMFLIAIFLIHPTLGWIVIGGLALLLLIMATRSVFAKGRSERFVEASNSIGRLKDMLLVSRDVIQTQQMGAAYNERWVQARRKSRDCAVELNDWKGWFSVLSTHTAMLMQYSVLAAGAYLTLNHQLTIGAMVATMFLSVRVFYPAERFVKQLPKITEAVDDWKRLDKTLKTTSPVKAHAQFGTDAALSISSLVVRSPLTKQQLLRISELEIEPGSVVEIVGKSGSGKTVFAETLLGRIERSGGKILFGGLNIDRLSTSVLSDTFAYLPQQVGFVEGSIEDNIAGLRGHPCRERLTAVAHAAQVHDLIIALPGGYGTAIDAAGGCFSKSERHQLALARALYSNPKMLVVDEPDQTFREGLSRHLKGAMSEFLARGGILIVLSRLGLKTFQPTRRFCLEDGLLKENTPLQDNKAQNATNGSAANVVRIGEASIMDKVPARQGIEP